MWHYTILDTISGTGIYYSNIAKGPQGHLHFILTQGDSTFHFYMDSSEWHKVKFHTSFRASKIIFGKDSTLYGVYKNRYVAISWNDLINGIVTQQDTIPVTDTLVRSVSLTVIDSILCIFVSKQTDSNHSDEIVFIKYSGDSWTESILDTSVLQGYLYNFSFSIQDTLWVTYNKCNNRSYQSPLLAFKYIHGNSWNKIYDSPSIVRHFNLLSAVRHGARLYFLGWFDLRELAVWEYDSGWNKINLIHDLVRYQDSFQNGDSLYVLYKDLYGEQQHWLAKNSVLTLSDSFDYTQFRDTSSNTIMSPRLGVDSSGNVIIVYHTDSLLMSAKYFYYPFPVLNLGNDSLFSYGKIGDTLIVKFTISNSGETNLNWNITSPFDWIIPTEPTGNLLPYKDTTLHLKIITATLMGYNQGNVYLHTNDPNDSLVSIKVSCYIFQDSSIMILGKDDHVQERELSIQNGSHQMIMRKFIAPHTPGDYLIHSIIARLGILQSSGVNLPVEFYVLPDSNGYPNFNHIILKNTLSVHTVLSNPPFRLFYKLKNPLLMHSDTFWVGISPAHPNIINLIAMIDTTSHDERNSYIYDSLSNTLELVDGNAIINAVCVTEPLNNNVSLESYDHDNTFEVPDRYIVPSFNVIEPKVRVVNHGRLTANNVPVILKIFNSAQEEIYNSRVVINALSSQEDTVVTFNPFTVLDSGLTYIFKAYTQYPDDYSRDDTLIVKVISSPREWLRYDLGTYNLIKVFAGVGGSPETGIWKRLSLSSIPAQILKIGLYGSADSIKFYFFEDSDFTDIHDFQPLDTFFLQSSSHSFGGGGNGYQGFRIVDLENDSIIINDPEVYVSTIIWGGYTGYTVDFGAGIEDNYNFHTVPVSFCYLNRDTQYIGNIYHGRYSNSIFRVQVKYPLNPATLIHEGDERKVDITNSPYLKYKKLIPYLVISTTEENEVVYIKVYDVSGRLIKNIKHFAKKGTVDEINLSRGLGSGVYFLTLRFKHSKPRRYKFIIFDH